MDRLVMVLFAMMSITTIVRGYDCDKSSLSQYVTIYNDVCLVCPHRHRINLYWRFTIYDGNTPVELMYNDSFTKTISANKYVLGNNPYELIVHNVSAADVGLYQCAVNGLYDESPIIHVYLLIRKTVHNPTIVSCSVHTSYRVKWMIAPIDNDTPPNDDRQWKSVDSNDVRVVSGLDIKFNKSIPSVYGNLTSAKYACQIFTLAGLLVGARLYDVYVYDNLCEFNRTYCSKVGTCIPNDAVAGISSPSATCKCMFFYTGPTCRSHSMFDLLLYYGIAITLYVSSLLCIHIFIPNKSIIKYVCGIIVSIMYIITIIYLLLHIYVGEKMY